MTTRRKLVPPRFREQQKKKRNKECSIMKWKRYDVRRMTKKKDLILSLS